MQVPAGRAQVAERPHDAPVVPTAAHGYFGEGVALAARLGLVVLVVRRVRVVVVVRERGPGAHTCSLAQGWLPGLVTQAESQWALRLLYSSVPAIAKLLMTGIQHFILYGDPQIT